MTILDLSIVPVKEGSNKKDIAEAIIEVKRSGLDYKLHDMGTTIAGPLDKCLETVNKAVMKLANYSDRLYTIVKIDNDKTSEKKIGDRTKEVEALINETINK